MMDYYIVIPDDNIDIDWLYSKALSSWRESPDPWCEKSIRHFTQFDMSTRPYDKFRLEGSR